MHLLLADENFSLEVSIRLSELGHDVITLQDLGLAGIKYPDEEVLQKGIELKRCILTFNRKDFLQLHKKNPTHAGIIICTFSMDGKRLAEKIHSVLEEKDSLACQLIRIYRDQK